MKGPQRRNYNAFKFAMRWLGLHNTKKRDVAIAAADALGCAHPKSKADALRILQDFHKAFEYAPPPYVSGLPKRRQAFAANDAFLRTFEWRQLRMVVLKKRGARCECCGASPKDGIVIHVDHIQPRRTHPELALTEANLQVLCEVCNHGKGSWDSTDWRTDSQMSAESSKNSPVSGTGDGDGHVVQPDTNRLRPRLVKTS